MVKCPFCHFDNEDGALFCEQCKSDLAAAPAAPPHVVQAVPMAAPIEAVPYAGAMDSAAIPAMPVAGMVADAVHDTMPIAGLAGTESSIPMAGHIMEAVPVEMAEAIVHAAPEAPPASPAAEAAPTTPPSSAPTAAAPMAPTAEAVPLPAGAQPRLVVLRGQKRNVEYPIYEGHNFIGRADEKPVDIDLEDQEPPDRVWSSRQHALITLENNVLVIEDLNSSNGTFVNRGRIYPGQKRPLAVNDVVQIGNVQLKLLV